MHTSSSGAAVLAASIVVLGLVAVPLQVSGQVPEALDDTTTVYSLAPIVVRGRADDLTGVASSASQGYVGRRDLMARPLTREGELFESVPGMILTQHSGGGKANQIFIRGFNLDHGTDFATWLEGMPINIPTHAHGQGYTDLNFLIPELVDHIEYSLGNYYAEIGDFSAAGGAHLRLRQRLERPLFEVGMGENGHERLLAAASADVGSGGTLLVGGEVHRYDGPWALPERLRKLSGLVRYTHRAGPHTFSLLGMAYDNSWHATDQIPSRAVESGLIDRYGNIDPTLGGASYRYSLSGSWNREGRLSSERIEAYAVHYDLDLFSNFTYLLADPADGDQFRQQDKGRWTLGANLAHLQSISVGDRMHRVEIGAQVRRDLADLTLSRTHDRATLGVTRSDDVNELATGVYAQLESPWADHFRTVVGLRGDLYRFDVTSDRPENTGNASDHIFSPKLSLVFGPWSGTELYVSGGLGFHSNDARGTVTTVDPVSGSPMDPVDPLVRSKGAEVGVRASPVSGWRSTLSLWTLQLDSELLYVGDAGTNEPSDPTRRLGVTFTNFYDITEQLSADLDVSFTRARFLDVDSGQDRIPGALEDVIAAGLTYRPTEDGPLGAVRLRHFGAYPMLEDDSERAKASSLVNFELGYRLGRAELRAELLNVLDEKSSDIQYYYESRLSAEPAGGVGDVHFHPAVPREIRVALSWGM
jgi:hypothetical protein